MSSKKSLIKRHEIQIAKRKRLCKNSKQTIEIGEKCLIVRESQYDAKTYSKKIALEMIAISRKKLAELEDSLSER